MVSSGRTAAFEGDDAGSAFDQSMSAPAARIRWTAIVTSGPMPSPGIRTMVCFVMGAEYTGLAAHDNRGIPVNHSRKSDRRTDRGRGFFRRQRCVGIEHDETVCLHDDGFDELGQLTGKN